MTRIRTLLRTWPAATLAFLPACQSLKTPVDGESVWRGANTPVVAAAPSHPEQPAKPNGVAAAAAASRPMVAASRPAGGMFTDPIFQVRHTTQPPATIPAVPPVAGPAAPPAVNPVLVPPQGVPAAGGPAGPAWRGAEGGESFWAAGRGRPEPGRGWWDEPEGGRPAWSYLPRMLGSDPRSASGAQNPADISPNGPRNQVDVRSSGSAVGGATYTTLLTGLEFASPDYRTGFGAYGGAAGIGGVAGGIAPSLYLKRAFYSTDDLLIGGALGGTLPIGEGARGGIFPWLFTACRVTGETWLQGSAGVTIPFSDSPDTVAYLDYGAVVPLFQTGTGSRATSVYFLPELHASFALNEGNRGELTGVDEALVQRVGGTSGFVLNATLGFGVRRGPFDVQAGVAFPLLTERFYDYESILRVSYQF